MGIIPDIFYYTTTTHQKATYFGDFFIGFRIFGSLPYFIGGSGGSLRRFVIFSRIMGIGEKLQIAVYRYNKMRTAPFPSSVTRRLRVPPSPKGRLIEETALLSYQTMFF